MFTGWQLKASETDDLLAAAGPGGVWTTNALADPFVSWHLTLDLVFTLVLAWAFYRCLFCRQRGAGGPHEDVEVAAVVCLRLPVHGPAGDLLDLPRHGLLDRGLVCTFDISPTDAWVTALSDFKWLAVATNVLLILGCYFWGGGQGTVSWQRHKEFRWRLRKKDTRIIGPPTGAVVVVALLLVLLALPAGAPWTRCPDVVRAQIDHLQEGDPAMQSGPGCRCPLPADPPGSSSTHPSNRRLDLDNGAWLFPAWSS